MNQIRLISKEFIKDPILIDPSKIVLPGNGNIFLRDGGWLEVRSDGEFASMAIFLPEQYNYTLGIDNKGMKILVITKGV